MKKNILFPAVFFVATAFAQPSQQKIEDFELNGPVKSVSTSYISYGKKPQYNMEMEYSNEFNESGLVSEWAFWMSFFNLRSNGGYNYDESGRLIEETQASGETSYVKAKYLYNSNNTISEIQTLSDEGEVEETVSFSYDDNDNVILKETFLSDGASSSKYIYKYDENGNCIERVEDWEYSKDIYQFKYDDEGNEIEEHYSQTSTYDTELADPVSYYTKYNADGQWIEITTIDAKGKISSRSTRTFDADGKQTHAHFYNGKGKVTSYTLYTDHDKHGNWTEGVTYSGKKITAAESRKITFY